MHGLSRVLDPGAFAWTDARWQPPPLSSGVVYELHVVTFTPEGTFESAIGRLDHLAGLGGARFVGFVQNHDQVGNRARGERLCQLVSPARARIAAAILATAPFVPMLFIGEEWGASTPFLYFTDHEDADLARGVSEGRRREFAAFGWKPEEIPDPQAPETCARSRLDWTEPEREPHRRLLRWYRDLLSLRRQRGDLRDGRMDRVRARWDEAVGWLTFQRGGTVVACNFAPEPRGVPLDAEPRALLLGSEPGIEPGHDVQLPRRRSRCWMSPADHEVASSRALACLERPGTP